MRQIIFELVFSGILLRIVRVAAYIGLALIGGLWTTFDIAEAEQSFRCCPIGTYLNNDGRCVSMCPNGRLDNGFVCQLGFNPGAGSGLSGPCLDGSAPEVKDFQDPSISLDAHFQCNSNDGIPPHPICALGETKTATGCKWTGADNNCTVGQLTFAYGDACQKLCQDGGIPYPTDINTPPTIDNFQPTTGCASGYFCCPAGTAIATGGGPSSNSFCVQICDNSTYNKQSDRDYCRAGIDPRTLTNDPSTMRCIDGSVPDPSLITSPVNFDRACIDHSPILSPTICPAGQRKIAHVLVNGASGNPLIDNMLICGNEPTDQQASCMPGEVVGQDGNCQIICSTGIAYYANLCASAAESCGVASFRTQRDTCAPFPITFPPKAAVPSPPPPAYFESTIHWTRTSCALLQRHWTGAKCLPKEPPRNSATAGLAPCPVGQTILNGKCVHLYVARHAAQCPVNFHWDGARCIPNAPGAGVMVPLQQSPTIANTPSRTGPCPTGPNIAAIPGCPPNTANTSARPNIPNSANPPRPAANAAPPANKGPTGQLKYYPGMKVIPQDNRRDVPR